MLNFTVNDIAAALAFIDSSDTERWLRAGMAIKSEFGDAGFDVWDDWSAADSRYKPKETRTKWKSFKGSSARGRVSIGSVMHWAFERGFKLDRPELTPEQRAQFAAEQEQRRAELAAQWAQEEADIARWYDVVAATCQQLEPLLKPVGSSPYLGKKKINSAGCLFPREPFLLDFHADFRIEIITGYDAINAVFARAKANKAAGEDTDAFVYVKRGAILIPLRNMAGEVRNYQVIYGDGKTKRFLTNGQKAGLFSVIGSLADTAMPMDGMAPPLVFVEGFATGASINLAVNWPVVVTFDAGNMPAVAEVFKSVDRQKLFAGDNDWETAMDPKKKNTGLIKCQEAARIAGGAWCVPQFTGDATGLSDFNDLHVSSGSIADGLKAVAAQLQAALNNSLDQNLSPDYPNDSAPPDFGDIPLPEDYAQFDSGSPEPSTQVEALSLESLLTRYALIDPDGKVWDSFQKRIIKIGAFKNIVTPKLHGEWIAHEKRRTVLLDDVERQAAAAQKKGRGGLAEALNRYVYLNPSDSAWDKQTREVVSLGHLKYAIADCFTMWISHPDREEIPMRNLVFDPTQQVDTATHINQYRGLALQPGDNIGNCAQIIRMMQGLCNFEGKVFKWLRRWLAYPLINVGAKMETSVLCHSDVHGSGKSFFFDVVMRSIYGEYSRTVGQAQLEGQYNDWMSKVLYCVYEEVLSRSQRYSHTGTIKQTITGKTVRIEKKFMSGWEEANHMNTVFLSNEVQPLPVEPSDRRFLVVWPETKLYEELQRGVDQELKNGGAAAFYRFLLQTKMQEQDEPHPFDEHTKPPMTAAKERLIEHGRAIWEVFFNEWANGHMEYKENYVPFCPIRVKDLYKIFEWWCKQNNEHSMGAHKFSSFISSKLKKRRDLHYAWQNSKGKSTFYLTGNAPEGKSQEEWLGACVWEIERIFQNDEPSLQAAA